MSEVCRQWPMKTIAAICWRYTVREMAIFGSARRGDFRSDSDSASLVEFEPTTEVGFLVLGRLRPELSKVLGWPVDLVPKGGLKPLIREAILAEAEVLYAV